MFRPRGLAWEELDYGLGSKVQQANADPYRYEVAKVKDGAELRIMRRDNLDGIIAFQDFSVFARDVSAAKKLAAAVNRALYKARHYNGPVRF